MRNFTLQTQFLVISGEGGSQIRLPICGVSEGCMRPTVISVVSLIMSDISGLYKWYALFIFRTSDYLFLGSSFQMGKVCMYVMLY